MLRSDVYVDNIERIEITTRTRELLLEEEPEKFEVRAFDDEGMFNIQYGAGPFSSALYMKIKIKQWVDLSPLAKA